MVRVKRGYVARRRRKKLLGRAKGFRGSFGTVFRPAKQAVVKALSHATMDRRKKKRDFRALWITRINAAVKELGLSYNKFISGLKKANILLDRKALAELAANDMSSFRKLVERVAEGQK